MDFLIRLALRATGALPTVQPRLPARFEPTGGHAGTVSFSEVAAETSAPDPQPAAPHASAIERPQAGPAAFQGVQPMTAAPAAGEPPRVTVSEGTRPEPQISRQSNATLPPEAPLSQDPPAAPHPAAASIHPLHDASLRPAPQPRPALRVEARRAKPEQADARPPDGAQPAAEAVIADRSAPTVTVRIGRIDVRAVMPPAQPPKPAARPAAARSSLEDYLSGHKGGSQP